MTVADKLKETVKELRDELSEAKDQIERLLPAEKKETDLARRPAAPEQPIET